MALLFARFAAHHMQDAVLAAEAGVDGILISNHGGEFP
jgi:isopentenyl diphosphate isomerase/L-lactate dehydrogenase-like FMN-dependent dehydrogenase